jgi:hypothetical protein
MIQEDYVSFETAKLLKEKGFDSEDCFAFYKKNGEIGFLQTFGDIADYDSEACVIAPTLQTAMKWLREVHNLFIEIRVGEIDGKTWYDFDIIPINGRKVEWNHYTNLPLVELNSHEEAVELALKYCLENLI